MANTDNVQNNLKSTKVDPVYLLKLMEKLEPYLQYQLKPANTRINLQLNQNPKCYFVRAGAISFYRQPDDILLELLEAPTLRGLLHIPPNSDSSYVCKTIMPSEIATISKDALFALFTEHQLWEIVARHQLEVNSMFVEVFYKRTTPTAYDIIRHQLYELINKPEALRDNILAETYIRSKTHLSRSGIMRILSALKEGGYIVIEKGILKTVNHLPENF